jgi:hypothetical protein
MTFDQIWENLCCKSPKLREDGKTVEFESQNLKRLLKQVYDQGYKQNTSVRDAVTEALDAIRPRNG